MAFLIQNTNDGLPAFYSPRIGRDFGAGAGGWTANQAEALQFAREQDAQTFMECFLPNVAPFCTITRHEGTA